ncbi:MAG: T9SS type A sorting domain-containing protein [Bacteroidales bacterium]|nr:T9SS type A sorting domain-containing protein [Bacteroidales bacterium]MCF8399634.1 T9SS type A sorting domain-containing protein [Bacteroidales bacterium]
MRVKTIILLLILLGFFSVSRSQIDTIVWQNCFGTVELDRPYTVAQSSNGYLFGISILKDGPGISNYHGEADAWIIQSDSTGNVVWERCFGGSSGDRPEKIVPINEQSHYLFNISNSYDGDVQNGRDGNFWIVKIDNLGNIIWENSFGNRSCYPRDAILTPDKGLLIMGRIMYAGGDVSTYYGKNDIWLCKIDSRGHIQWEKTLGNQGQDNAVKIKLASDSTFMMIGGHYESGGMIDCPDLGTDGADVWIVEVDMGGNIIRQYCYGGSRNDLGHDIIPVDSGYVFVASTNSFDGDISVWLGEDDIWVVKLDYWGNIIWEKSIGGSDYEYPVYITQTDDEGFIVMGNTQSNDGDVSGNHINNGGYYDGDIWVVKINSAGELEWQHCFGGKGTERFYGMHTVLKKSDYNYVILGHAEYASHDVECEVDPNPYYKPYGWLFEIKDCSLYAPQTPTQPTGPDTLCYTTDSISTYSISSAAKAWGYEWKIEPDNAGNLIEDSLMVYVEWNQQYEGEVQISARSYNDCGNSDWSEVKKTWVYNCVGVEEIGSGNVNIRVYPNPAREKLVVGCGLLVVGDANIQVFDVLGQRVKEINVPKGQNKTEIDVSNWQKGLFFVKVQSEDGGFGCVKMVVE